MEVVDLPEIEEWIEPGLNMLGLNFLDPGVYQRLAVVRILIVEAPDVRRERAEV